MNNLYTGINLLYFPLNITILDDEKEYTSIICSKLKNFTKNISIHNSPIDVKLNPISIDIKSFTKNVFSNTLDIDYKYIRDFIDLSQNKDGIIISDFNMPGMNGIQLMEKYKDFDIVKILLTNIYSPIEAVNALQDNIINHYIPKDNIDDISATVSKLQHKYFNDLSNKIINLLDCTNYEFLFDKDFLKIFDEVYKKFRVNKYYILNGYGNYYLENETGKYVLTIYNSSNLVEYVDAIPEIKKDNVINGNLIPSYFSADRLISADKFGDYSYSVEKYN